MAVLLQYKLPYFDPPVFSGLSLPLKLLLEFVLHFIFVLDYFYCYFLHFYQFCCFIMCSMNGFDLIFPRLRFPEAQYLSCLPSLCPGIFCQPAGQRVASVGRWQRSALPHPQPWSAGETRPVLVLSLEPDHCQVACLTVL